MKNYRYDRLKYLGITALLALPGMSMVNSAQAACYNTPHMAVEAFVTTSSVTPALKDGYQVTGIQSDLVLGERWATIVNCSHPEWPVLALPAPGGRSVIAPPEAQHALKDNVRKAPVVRAGDVVRMWRQERLLRIEFAGVSEESGDLGKTVRVRLLRRSTGDQSMPEQFSGIIRGPSDVEMQP
jgi:Chaperone for flagella basal body P-ring formation